MLTRLTILCLCSIALVVALEPVDQHGCWTVVFNGGGDNSLDERSSKSKNRDKEDDIKPAYVIKIVLDDLAFQLARGIQWLNGLIAMTIASALIINGELVFKSIVLVITSVFVYVMTLSNTEQFLDTNDLTDLVILHTVAAEVALASAVVLYKGYKDLHIFAGLLVGLTIFVYFQNIVQGNETLRGCFGNHILNVFLGNVCVLCGLFVFLKKSIYGKTVMIVSSFCGGCLLASSLGFFSEYICVYCPSIRVALTKRGFELPPICPAWQAFLKVLTTWTGEEVGILVTNARIRDSTNIYVDRWIGFIFWFIFTWVSLCVQNRRSVREGSGTDTSMQARERPLAVESQHVVDPLRPRGFRGRGDSPSSRLSRRGALMWRRGAQEAEEPLLGVNAVR